MDGPALVDALPAAPGRAGAGAGAGLAAGPVDAGAGAPRAASVLPADPAAAARVHAGAARPAEPPRAGDRAAGPEAGGRAALAAAASGAADGGLTAERRTHVPPPGAAQNQRFVDSEAPSTSRRPQNQLFVDSTGFGRELSPGGDAEPREPRSFLARLDFPHPRALLPALIREAFYLGFAAMASGLFRATRPLRAVSHTPGRLRRRRLDPGGPPPIVFVHGWGGDETNVLPLARRLAAAGRGRRPVVHGASLLDFRRPVEDLAEVALAAIRAALERTGAERVDVVAHSMGGLATRHLLLHLGGRTLVRRVATLASPHQGTALAVLGIGRPRIQCQPESEFLCGLAPDLRALPEGMLLSVFSDGDIIVPPVAARVPAPQKNLLVPGLGHVGILYDGRVARAVAAHLA